MHTAKGQQYESIITNIGLLWKMKTRNHFDSVDKLSDLIALLSGRKILTMEQARTRFPVRARKFFS